MRTYDTQTVLKSVQSGRGLFSENQQKPLHLRHIIDSHLII